MKHGGFLLLFQEIPKLILDSYRKPEKYNFQLEQQYIKNKRLTGQLWYSYVALCGATNTESVGIMTKPLAPHYEDHVCEWVYWLSGSEHQRE